MQLSREEYHAWLEQQPHGRFERVHGEVVELSPEPIAHARLKAAIWLALHDAIEATGLTALEGRKPGRSGPGKLVLPVPNTSLIETVRGGDNQAEPQPSASISTPAGQVGSACGALSAKDGVEAGSSPKGRPLGTSALQGREHVRACEALGDGPTVQVADGSDYEPDAVVTFGEPAPNDSIFVPNPLIVVEVLSRGTKKVDTTEKLFDYFTVPSIVHYLIFSVNQRKVVHHRRLDSAGNIATHVIADSGDIVLEPPGIAIALEPLYRRVL